jgi:hypothetical protein
MRTFNGARAEKRSEGQSKRNAMQSYPYMNPSTSDQIGFHDMTSYQKRRDAHDWLLSRASTSASNVPDK